MISLGPFQRLTGIEFPTGWVVLEQSGFLNPDAAFTPEFFEPSPFDPLFTTSPRVDFEAETATRQKLVARRSFEADGFSSISWGGGAGSDPAINTHLHRVFLNDLLWITWQPFQGNFDPVYSLPGGDTVAIQEGTNTLRIEVDNGTTQAGDGSILFSFFSLV